MQHRRSIAESATRTRSVRGTPKYLKKYFNDFALTLIQFHNFINKKNIIFVVKKYDAKN